ncbi:MAG: putative acrylyl-CoA reductase AcuI [Alphaproteobacteria bacterium MarineAlpha9_Bin4]|nr:MAG: putative acrylyl-CoA reductase AcuI [Alphaproteobacteria bacterium MarineAlpha9_Bin4]
MQNNYNFNCTKLGNIKNLEIKKIKRERIKQNSVRIQIHAIGLNYVDILMIKGKYQHHKSAPFIPGIEACGIIIDENCNNKKLINKKVIINKKGGCFSEEIVASLNEIIIIPSKIDCALAAGSFTSTLTSYITLQEIAKLKKNDNILITGASGGVGVASIKLAKKIGANVTSIVSTREKSSFVKSLGSNKTILLDSKKLENISNLKKKYNINVVLDINGLIKSKKLLSFLGWQGKYIIIGFMNNNIYSIPSNHILIKGLTVQGVRAGKYLENSNKKNLIIKNVINIIKKENINSIEYKIVEFKKLINYLLKLENRSSKGKNIVVTKYYKKRSL